MTAPAMFPSGATIVAEDGATVAYGGFAPRSVPAGTRARIVTRYVTWVGTVSYDVTVDGEDGAVVQPYGPWRRL